MPMRGTIRERDGKLYVVYATTEDGRPVRRVLWWAIASIHRDPYTNRAPSDGNTVEYRGNGAWAVIAPSSAGSVSTGDGTRQAEVIEEHAVPPPPARGKELRWHQGSWQRLTAKGWTQAGEGKSSRP